jgi:hypothetical protein
LKLAGLFNMTDGREMVIPARVLTAACVVAVLASIASLMVGAWDARRDKNEALQRYADTQALLALPPIDVEELRASRDAAVAARAGAEDLLAPPSVDPSSDDATTLLVQSAGAAGLVVRGIVSAPPAEVKRELVTYEASGLRMTVEGSPSQVIAFLTTLGEDEPGLIPTLTTMTTDDRNVSRAEITFNVYTKVVPPTPIAPAPGADAR